MRLASSSFNYSIIITKRIHPLLSENFSIYKTKILNLLWLALKAENMILFTED